MLGLITSFSQHHEIWHFCSNYFRIKQQLLSSNSFEELHENKNFHSNSFRIKQITLPDVALLIKIQILLQFYSPFYIPRATQVLELQIIN